MGKGPLFIYLERLNQVKAMKGDLSDRVREVTRDLVRGLGLELVGVEVSRLKGRTFLRVTIDKEEGVTVDECASTSRMLVQVVDREGLMDGDYMIEVQSPGLDRPLKTTDDFLRSMGKRVKVKLAQPFEGESILTGFIRGAGGDSFTIESADELLELRYESVKGVRLHPELPW